MATCPSCASEVPDRSRFCLSCGAAIETPTSAPTETSLKSHSAATSHPSLDKARFIPGTVLAKRYRIISLLGRGGMGEVYRADDLKLGQPVALKFLPAAVEKDPARLERFLNEVKIARQISHPNVCRVYDVGEVDGHHFISMEYVDGQDLASLLHQVGRLPEAKATQIARQLCAGLAAAHEQRILHRDLKPANVMIDGRGRAKITDFGLASLADMVEADEVRAGTPAYMAPEQLAGEQVTIRSDLYALGLVLYELFTGERAFDATTPAEMLRLERESKPSSPSSHVEGMDPVVERVILRCLEPEPAERPESTLAISAALPGGDPLAVALAAGETPSPELVAAAGHTDALKPAIAVFCLVFALAGLVLTAYLHGRFSLLGYISSESSREILVDRARQIVQELGYEDPPADTAHGFYVDWECLRYVRENDPSPDRWDRLASTRPAAIRLWYRQSPRPLVPKSVSGIVTGWDPWMWRPGEIRVTLDLRGQLNTLVAVPPQREDPEEPVPDPDWSLLLDKAGLDPALLSAVPSEWVPLSYSDARAAWVGTYPDQEEPPIRVEAAAYRGRPVYFDPVLPWDRPAEEGPRERTLRERAQITVWNVLFVAAVVGALALARRNLRLGRADRGGAMRLAVFVVATSMLAWALSASHVADFREENWLFTKGLGRVLYDGVYIWVIYVALEPFIRRQWPETIVSWTRLLSGRFRDPLVGRHVLFGAAFGVALAVVEGVGHIAPTWFGWPTDTPPSVDLTTLEGPWRIAAEFLRSLYWHLKDPFYFIFLLVLIRFVVRKLWIAMVLFGLVITVAGSLTAEPFPVAFVTLAVWISLGLFCIVKFGFVGTISAHFFGTLGSTFPLTLDTSAWYWDASLAGLLVGAAGVLFAFHVSLAGKPLFRDAPIATG